MNSCRVRIIMIRQVAEMVFNDRLQADWWLRNTNPSLGGRTPLSQIHSSFGAQLVLNELSRIDLARKDRFSSKSSIAGRSRRSVA